MRQYAAKAEHSTQAARPVLIIVSAPITARASVRRARESPPIRADRQLSYLPFCRKEI
jgi:hypothetical protein